MSRLILHPTDVSQWHTIINEAQSHTQIILSEDTESYLVFLLMRFCKDAELVNAVMAMDLLHGIHLKGQQRLSQLQAVGDKSLLFSGMFPGLIEKRRVHVDYYIQLGQTAYLSASGYGEHPQASLFEKLGLEFVSLQKILRSLK